MTQIGSIPTALRMTLPQYFGTRAEERALFQRELRSFIPPDCFDVHAHLYSLDHIARVPGHLCASAERDANAGYETYLEQQRGWMGDRAPRGGLFFGFPFSKSLDTAAANGFLHGEIQAQPESRGLLLIRPTDDAANVEAQISREGWAGFKVYHVFADRRDTFNAEIGEFLPEWAWDIANRRELCIMLHLVRERSLADERNQGYIRSHCKTYPGAKLILAHAARGFCAAHTVEGIGTIRGLDNVYFDTSAICEAPALEAVLDVFGPTRLMYGSDFPIAQTRGRCVSLGDSYHWIYEFEQDEWPSAQPVLIGIESLLALRRACRTCHLTDSDVELIFRGNAHLLLGIGRVENGKTGQELYREAKQLIPGGTQLLSKRPELYAPEVWPPYFREARGIEIITHDGRRLLDFTTTGIGSCLLGYSHPEVNAAVQRRISLGAMSTLNAPEEVQLARELLALHPWAEQARFARTGGEALSAAVRIARAATGRDIIAFCGYHGWHDWYLAANCAQGDSLGAHLLPGLEPNGVPGALQGTAIPFSYNDLDGLKRIILENKGRLAAVVMEPTRNILPGDGFLQGVRDLCDENGLRLIFDEVTSGFRLHHGGVHLKFGVDPDIAVFGKALGNGHPIAAIIGKRSTMEAAQGSFISSTYWTESVGPAAALATLKVLSEQDVPAHAAEIGNQVRRGLAALAEEHGVPLQVSGDPALTFVAFAHPHAAELMTLFTSRMIGHGYLASGSFYPTFAHDTAHVEGYLQVADLAFRELGEAIRVDDVRERLSTPVKASGFRRLN